MPKYGNTTLKTIDQVKLAKALVDYLSRLEMQEQQRIIRNLKKHLTAAKANQLRSVDTRGEIRRSVVDFHDDKLRDKVTNDTTRKDITQSFNNAFYIPSKQDLNPQEQQSAIDNRAVFEVTVAALSDTLDPKSKKAIQDKLTEHASKKELPSDLSQTQQRLLDCLKSLSMKNHAYLAEYNTGKREKSKGGTFFANTDQKYKNAVELDKELQKLIDEPENLSVANCKSLVEKFQAADKETMGMLSSHGAVHKMLDSAKTDIKNLERTQRPVSR